MRWWREHLWDKLSNTSIRKIVIQEAPKKHVNTRLWNNDDLTHENHMKANSGYINMSNITPLFFTNLMKNEIFGCPTFKKNK